MPAKEKDVHNRAAYVRSLAGHHLIASGVPEELAFLKKRIRTSNELVA